LRLLNQVAAFHYVTAPNAPTYRALVQAFREAKQHYVIELRPADALDRVRRAGYHVEAQDEDDVRRHLDQLVTWGNLSRTHDPVAVSRIDDFYKGRYVYHLTAVGEAAHRAVLDVEATVGKSGSLQSTMLVKIRDALRALATAASAEPVAPDVLVRLLHDLHSAFDTLTEEANRFMGDLGRYTRGERVEEGRFVLYKQAVLAYISRFVEQLRHLAGEIASSVDAVESAGAGRLLVAAARSADLPPALPDTDPVAAWVDEQQARWAGVCAWFVGDAAGHRPTIERLAEVAVDAVVELTRTLGRLNERRTRPVDRAADFRSLARWFSRCSDDDEAHRLWHAAFGLHSARHFHIEEDDPDRTGALMSWWEAAPVEVPVRLRTRGSTSNAGRPSPAADHGREKEWIAQRRRRERARLEAALARFAGRGPLPIADLGSVDAAELELLLALLDEALSAPREPDGTRRARTSDGRLSVALHAPAGDAVLAALDTPQGRLRCLNYRIVVEEVGSLAVAVGERP
jgi:uncharacterized protein (TIGR02677 family)